MPDVEGFTLGKVSRRGIEVKLGADTLLLPAKYARRIDQLERLASTLAQRRRELNTHQGHAGNFETCMVLACIQERERLKAGAE